MDFFYLKPFNLLFFILIACAVGLSFLLGKIMKGKSRDFRRNFLKIMYSCVFVFFFVYKYWLSKDAEYSNLCYEAGFGAFSWGKELPLQLCNINIWLMILAVIFDKPILYGFVFYIASLGAFMPMVAPALGFYGYSFLLPRMLGYWITHLAVFMESFLMAQSGLYKPKYRDVPLVAAMLVGVTFIIFCYDLVVSKTGLCPNVNYFYALGTEGNPVLNIMWNIVPVPFVYLLLGLAVLVPYQFLLTFIGKKLHIGEQRIPL